MNVLITYTVIQVHLIQWHEFSVFNHPQCSIREPAGTSSDDNLWHTSYCFWTQHVPVVVFVKMQMFCWVCFRGPVPDVRTWRQLEETTSQVGVHLDLKRWNRKWRYVCLHLDPRWLSLLLLPNSGTQFLQCININITWEWFILFLPHTWCLTPEGSVKTFLSLVIYFLSDLNDFLSCVDELTAGGKNTLHDHLSN